MKKLNHILIALFILVSCINLHAIKDTNSNTSNINIIFNTYGIYLNGTAECYIDYKNDGKFSPIKIDNQNIAKLQINDIQENNNISIKLLIKQRYGSNYTFTIPIENFQANKNYNIPINYCNGEFILNYKKIENTPINQVISNTILDTNVDSYTADPRNAEENLGDMKLTWHDEFNAPKDSSFDTTKWSAEHGFVRNQEDQWYQADNAKHDGKGNMLIQARREKVLNTNYDPNAKGDNAWKKTRKYAEYTSACIETKEKYDFLYGTMVVRAKFPISKGSWPAIWTLGNKKNVGGWPGCGEIDLFEYYLVNNQPTILANMAFAGNKAYDAIWNSNRLPLSKFTENDPEWINKYHIWRMDWSEDFIRIYLDGELLNEQEVSKCINGYNGGNGGQGMNPFHYGQEILLNLAIGGQHGGDPSNTQFPLNYYIDYVRVYQHK